MESTWSNGGNKQKEFFYKNFTVVPINNDTTHFIFDVSSQMGVPNLEFLSGSRFGFIGS
jgi:hypothetical protein